MKSTSICGIPVHVDRTGDTTVIRPQWRASFTNIQSRLIGGWLEHKGNTVSCLGATIQVTGDLQPGSLANVGKSNPRG